MWTSAFVLSFLFVCANNNNEKMQKNCHWKKFLRLWLMNTLWTITIDSVHCAINKIIICWHKTGINRFHRLTKMQFSTAEYPCHEPVTNIYAYQHSSTQHKQFRWFHSRMTIGTILLLLLVSKFAKWNFTWNLPNKWIII